MNRLGVRISGIMAAIRFKPDGGFPCFVTGAPLWCAFFILRTLKRAGYSAARVTPEPGGLRIDARR